MWDPTLTFLAASVIAASVFLITLISTDAAIVLLIYSMLLSPEISMGGGAGRAIVVRLDDLLLIVIFFTWLAKLAINKQLGLLRHTPLNVPLFAFIVSCILSTGWGALAGHLYKPVAGLFYVIK